jgi:hypothetical protein|tara:strand:- start:978 stop:1331 length:354 start_codon:yes stop_codon:yes gene_type:complete
MNYTVYTTSTGEVISTGSSNVTNISDIAVATGQTAVEGTYPPGQYKFVDGKATAIAEDPLDYIRAHRTYLLNESDWTQVADSPLTNAKKTEWATYRQALRDLPASTDDPIVWPTPPE